MMEPFFTFRYWAEERERIRKGYPSQDAILNQYRFCNISREHDRGTIRIDSLIRRPWDVGEDDPLRLLQALTLARLINNPATLLALTSEGVIEPGKAVPSMELADRVRAMQARGDQTVFGNAYMVPSRTNEGTRKWGEGKIAFFCHVLECLKMPPTHTRQAFHAALAECYGMGEFLAGQVTADAAHTRLLRAAPDGRTWAPRGPGAMRGMNVYLAEREGGVVHLHRNLTEDSYILIGREMMKKMPVGMVEELNLTLHDVASNVCCESGKYWQLKNGLRAGRRYP